LRYSPLLITLIYFSAELKCTIEISG